MKILAVSGSLRKESTNSKLIEAAKLLSNGIANVETTDLVRHLPLFDPDLAAHDISVVEQWVHCMKQADALLVSTPEYARGYPGALKNAFDWLVQGDGFVEKPFAFLIASERAEHSHKTLSVVLETMSGKYISDANVTIPLLGTDYTAAEIASDREFSDAIKASLTILGGKVDGRD